MRLRWYLFWWRATFAFLWFLINIPDIPQKANLMMQIMPLLKLWLVHFSSVGITSCFSWVGMNVFSLVTLLWICTHWGQWDLSSRNNSVDESSEVNQRRETFAFGGVWSLWIEGILFHSLWNHDWSERIFNVYSMWSRVFSRGIIVFWPQIFGHHEFLGNYEFNFYMRSFLRRLDIFLNFQAIT